MQDIDVGLEGVQAELRDWVMIVKFSKPFWVLSSAVLNGGLTKARSIVNYRVPMNFNEDRPEEFLKRSTSAFHLPQPVVGMMTAVKLEDYSVMKERAVVAIITAGLSYPAAAGDKIRMKGHQGTINTILIIDENLTKGAMVEVVKTATEAKVLALRDLDVRSRFSGEVASGTTTDAIAVSCSGKGRELRYSGSATEIGQSIARCVRKGTKEAIRKHHGL